MPLQHSQLLSSTICLDNNVIGLLLLQFRRRKLGEKSREFHWAFANLRAPHHFPLPNSRDNRACTKDEPMELPEPSVMRLNPCQFIPPHNQISYVELTSTEFIASLTSANNVQHPQRKSPEVFSETLDFRFDRLSYSPFRSSTASYDETHNAFAYNSNSKMLIRAFPSSNVEKKACKFDRRRFVLRFAFSQNPNRYSTSMPIFVPSFPEALLSTNELISSLPFPPYASPK